MASCFIRNERGSQRSFTDAIELELIVHTQNRQEGFLWDFHTAHLLHTLLAGFLFFQQLLLARNIAAITLCQHIFSHGLDVLARDDIRSDSRLYRHIVHLARYKFAHLGRYFTAAVLAVGAMHELIPRQMYD